MTTIMYEKDENHIVHTEDEATWEKRKGEKMNMKKSIQIIFLLGGLLALTLVIVAYNMYTKPHRSVEDETAIAIVATELFDAYEKNETAANTKYLNQVSSK